MVDRVTVSNFIRWLDRIAQSDPDRIIGRFRDPELSPVCVYLREQCNAAFSMLLPGNRVYAEYTGYIHGKTHFRNYNLPSTLYRLTDRIWFSDVVVTARQCVRLMEDLGYTIPRVYPIRLWPVIVPDVMQTARSKWQNSIVSELIDWGYVRYPLYTLPKTLRNSYGSSYSASADNLFNRLNGVLRPYGIELRDAHIIDTWQVGTVRPMRCWYVTIKS
jgi:hypothetical protein